MEKILSIIWVIILCFGVIVVIYQGIQFAKEMSKPDEM